MFNTLVLFVLAGFAEIGGGYLIWLCLREAKSAWFGLIGGLILVLYGIIPTLQKFPSFGRVYAAYGGVFIILSILWGWGVDRKTPDVYDWIGADLSMVLLVRWTFTRSYLLRKRE